MIQQQTILKVTDNSGAKSAICIKIIGGFKRKTAKIGDIVIVSIRNLRNKAKIESKVHKGEVYKAIILRTKNKKRKKDGSLIFFSDNTVSLINKQGKPFATRLLGPIPKEFKKSKSFKFAGLASGFV